MIGRILSPNETTLEVLQVGFDSLSFLSRKFLLRRVDQSGPSLMCFLFKIGGQLLCLRLIRETLLSLPLAIVIEEHDVPGRVLLFLVAPQFEDRCHCLLPLSFDNWDWATCFHPINDFLTSPANALSDLDGFDHLSAAQPTPYGPRGDAQQLSDGFD